MDPKADEGELLDDPDIIPNITPNAEEVELLDDPEIFSWRPMGKTASAPSPLAPEFSAAAATMPELVRGLLVEGVEPGTVPVSSLLCALSRSRDRAATRAAHKAFNVMQVSSILSPTACATLRTAVDRDRRVVADSVDGLPEHQLCLTDDALKQLVGKEEHARLMGLPAEYLLHEMKVADPGAEAQLDPSTAERFSQLRESFVRRYSADTRPFNPFHQDSSRITVNVALSDDSAHVGGRLLGVFGGKIHTLERTEGAATVHSSELLHAVTSMTSGARYSLILFFDPLPRVVRKDGQVEDRWANRKWAANQTVGARWWE